MSEYNIARDVLEFRLTGYRYGPDSFPMAAVEIYINGENFRETLEKKYASKNFRLQREKGILK